MTSQKIKFYKFSNSTTQATKITDAKAVEGAIIYIVDLQELWIGGATAKMVLKGANNVTFDNNKVLTITNYSENGVAETKTLDFSDVASAEATLHVFQTVYGLMGTTASGSTQTLNYSGTNYLSDLGTSGHPDKNLVNADKALDAAILEATLKDGTTGADYDTTAQQISKTWITTVNTNAITDNETLNTSVNKLDKKIAGLADELIRDEQVTQQAFTTVANSVGLKSDMSLDLSDASQTGAIHGDKDVKSALIHLDNAISTNKLDVQVDGSTIVNNHIANINTEDTYNASTNKLATKATVTNAINALYVDTDKGAASISGSTITIKAVQQENGLVIDGGTTTINLDGTYDASTNKIATKSTVTTAIEALDATNIQGVDYTAADSSNGAKLTFKGVSETDGVIAQGSGTTQLQFAKVATTGAASDVTIADAGSLITATNVEDALQEIATNVKDLVGGMRYNGNISNETATLNSSTHDIRPGDIYLASRAFTIGTSPDEVSVEAGDMLVYKGTKITSTVTLTPSNCTVIEKETDTMVTAGGTLADDYIVFGNGNKEVTTTSNDSYTITASQLNTAITKANSALQSISNGTDGTYVTTTIGTKANNDQTVGVALKEGTVTYTAKSGDKPADLSVTSGNEGVLTTAAVTPIKNYVDEKVSNVVSDLDVAEYQQASVEVDTTNRTSTLKIKGIKEDDGKIAAATTTQTTDVAIDGEYNASTNKVATQTTVTNAINTLNANPTSDDLAVANVQVVETNGVIKDVVVTNNSAGVSYTASVDGSSAPNLTASTKTGAVTGADISTIKSYIDDKSSMCWEEYD